MPLPTPEEPKKYTTIYSDFRGVDFTNDASTVYKARSPYAVNIIPDAGGTPHKRTGWAVKHTPSDAKKVRNMWSFDYAGESHLVYVRGDKVYRLGEEETIVMSLSEDTTEVTGVYFNSMSGGRFYFLADSKLMEYQKVDGSYTTTEIASYIPTVLIGRSPSGGGTMLENVNLLTRRRKELFLGDSTSKEFYVSSTIDTAEPVIVMVKQSDGEFTALTKGTDYTVNKNSITLTKVYEAVTQEDNISIEYASATKNTASEALKRCTIASVYDNRVFLTGTDGELKSRIWFSAYANPTYFPDLSYLVAGDDFGGVMGLIDLGEYLGVVKESNPKASTIYLAYPTTVGEESTFAIKQSITGVGALSKKTFNSLNGEQLFLSDDGIYGIMADMQSSEVASSFVKNRSYYVNGKLLKEPNLHESIAVVWDGFYILCVNSHCYLLDSTQKSSWATERTNMQYEAYYWENIPATAFCVHGETLYFGTEDGRVCFFKTVEEYGYEAFNDDGWAISCEWRTIHDSDGAIHFFKNLQKKGCVVVLQNTKNSAERISAEVLVRADAGEEKYIGSISTDETSVPSEFYLNKKVKKYKRLQIIVRNDMLNEPFGVQEIVKTYTVGNYSKNRNKANELFILFLDGNELYVNGYQVENMVRVVDEEQRTVTLENDDFSIIYEDATGDLYYEEKRR